MVEFVCMLRVDRPYLSQWMVNVSCVFLSFFRFGRCVLFFFVLCVARFRLLFQFVRYTLSVWTAYNLTIPRIWNKELFISDNFQINRNRFVKFQTNIKIVKRQQRNGNITECVHENNKPKFENRPKSNIYRWTGGSNQQTECNEHTDQTDQEKSQIFKSRTKEWKTTDEQTEKLKSKTTKQPKK